jgi:hypothetical protein
MPAVANKKGKKVSKYEAPKNHKRGRISQADIPAYSVVKALRVARAIFDNYGKDPVKPLRVAQAMKVAPTSGPFRMLTGASVAYGLTDGGYGVANISLTPLARRIFAPTKEGDDLNAKREATLKPKIIADFLTRYNNSPLPADDIARNVLDEMGVPRDRTEAVFELIKECAADVGFLTEIKGKTYVDLQGVAPQVATKDDNANGGEGVSPDGGDTDQPLEEELPKNITPRGDINKVFITHGKNHSFLEPIKKLLSFGGFEAVVAAEKQTVAQPVPDKVMESMRGCGAAIIHIEAEQKLIDPETKEHVVLNPNVLIEIGAAMALYGKRFILLVKEGVQLPSNLQGLYEVRYSGETLDSDVTIKLLEAINDIKGRPLPNTE